MFKLKQSMILSLMLVLCLSAGLSPVYAAGGDGTGGGNGENRDIPLTLESASIRDGSRDIPVNPTICLLYTSFFSEGWAGTKAFGFAASDAFCAAASDAPSPEAPAARRPILSASSVT